jgi:hypothetical protein
MIEHWKIPREWEGETAVVLGGGPSLKKDQLDYAIQRGFRRVAVNDAGLVFDPQADVICWGDPQWFTWNGEQLRLHKGKYKITWRDMPARPTLPYYRLQHPRMPPHVSFDQGAVCANNSGMGGINIAALFGAKRILLLGFDMRCVEGKNHWHNRHKTPTAEHRYGELYRPPMELAALEYAAAGIEVLNCTQYSSLKGYRYANLRGVV